MRALVVTTNRAIMTGLAPLCQYLTGVSTIAGWDEHSYIIQQPSLSLKIIQATATCATGHEV